MDFSQLLKITKYNLRISFLPHFAVTLAIALLTPVVFGITDLNFTAAAQPLEMLLSLSGAVLLTPVFYPEQQGNIRDVIRSKKTSYRLICLVRIAYSLVTLSAVIGIFTLVMKACGSSVHLVHFGSCFASAFFLGAIGLAFAGFSDNVIVGYMAALVYYIANMGIKEKLGDLFLFTLSMGGMSVNYTLFFGGIILITATLIFAKPLGNLF